MTAEPEPLSSPSVEEAPHVSVHPHRLRMRFLAAFVIGLLAVLGVGVGALYSYDQQYQGRILPGVHVAHVDLSGLTPAAAAGRLHEAYDRYNAGQVVLVARDKRLTISFQQIARQVAIDSMVERAMTVGRAGGPVERVIANARTAFRGVILDPEVQFDPDALVRHVGAVAASRHQSPADATISLTKAGFVVTDSVTGRESDPSTVLGGLARTLARIDAPAEVAVNLPTTDLDPSVTTAEATAAVDAANRIAQDVTITDANAHWTIPAATIRSWITFQSSADGAYQPVVDTTKIDLALAPAAAAITRRPKNATFRVIGTKVVVAAPSANGRTLDRKATAASVARLLSSRATVANSSAVSAVVGVKAPALSTAQAQAAAPKMREISTWTTYFFITERNHFGANIWIPAQDIDGQVVAPGETFDWWKAVGPVTRARGYGDGGAIINGKTEPQGALAGGICSCSTTLFNAALRAGMNMKARANHFYYIDRYPIGLDATVFKSSSGSTQTMSWTNDTNYPVLIRGFKIRGGGKGYVKFSIYSVPNGRKVVISAPTIKNVRPSWDSVVYTTSLAPGLRNRVEYPVDGKDVWRTVTVYENGKVIHQTTYHSHYARITGVTLIGR